MKTIVKTNTNNLTAAQLMILVITTKSILDSLPAPHTSTRPPPKGLNGFKEEELYRI